MLKEISPSQKLKALFLDFDGTIADSLPMLYRYYDLLLQKFGYSGSKEEFDRLNGPSMNEVMVILQEKYQLPASSQELLAAYQQQLLKAYATEVPLFPGVREFLIEAQRCGLTVAIVTSAARKIVEGFLAGNGIAHFFAEVVTAEGLPLSKPHPGVYERALSALCLQPGEVVAVEDSPNGVQAALGAQIPTMMISHDTQTDLLPPKILAHVTSWAEAGRFINHRLSAAK